MTRAAVFFGLVGDSVLAHRLEAVVLDALSRVAVAVLVEFDVVDAEEDLVEAFLFARSVRSGRSSSDCGGVSSPGRCVSAVVLRATCSRLALESFIESDLLPADP